METTSMRLPPDLLAAVARVAARRGVNRSVIVREALEGYLGTAGGSDLVDLVDRLVTYPGSGAGDLSARGEEILRKRFRARRLRPR